LNFENNSLALAVRRGNKLILDSINSNRLNSGLRPLRYVCSTLSQFAQKEADRMLAAEKLSEPNFPSDKKTFLLSVLISGDITVKEAMFDLNNGNYFFLQAS